MGATGLGSGVWVGWDAATAGFVIKRNGSAADHRPRERIDVLPAERYDRAKTDDTAAAAGTAGWVDAFPAPPRQGLKTDDGVRIVNVRPSTTSLPLASSFDSSHERATATDLGAFYEFFDKPKLRFHPPATPRLTFHPPSLVGEHVFWADMVRILNRASTVSYLHCTSIYYFATTSTYSTCVLIRANPCSSSPSTPSASSAAPNAIEAPWNPT
jgi:hypothetical protein